MIGAAEIDRRARSVCGILPDGSDIDMRGWWIVLAAWACEGETATDSGADTKASPDGPDEVDSREPVARDTFTSFDTDDPRDTWTPLDPAIGATPLAGTWVGTFELTEEIAVFNDTPKCEGAAELTIDGDASRHVVATFSCGTWDPNVDLLPGQFDAPYGELTGVGFGTIDPADPLKFRLDMSLVASAMIPVDLDRVLVRQEEEVLVLDWDNFAGVGPLRVGHRVQATFTRLVLP